MTQQSDLQTNKVPKKVTKQSEAAPSSKEVFMLGTGLLFLSLSIGGMVIFSEDEPLQANAAKPVDIKKVSQAFHSQPPSAIPSVDFVSESPTATLISMKEEDLSSESSSPLNEVDIYFGFDQAMLSEDAKVIIQQQVDSYKDTEEWSMTIQGHADQNGSDTYNQALGLRRADAVKNYLTSHGIDESLLHVESLGSSSNICTEDNEECFQKNRRAHLIFTTHQQSASLDALIATESVGVEEEDTVSDEAVAFDPPLSEEEAPTTTALLSEAIEEIPTVQSITVSETSP